MSLFEEKTADVLLCESEFFTHCGLRYHVRHWSRCAQVQQHGDVCDRAQQYGNNCTKEQQSTSSDALSDVTSDAENTLNSANNLSGVPLILLHGFAQSSKTWQTIANKILEKKNPFDTIYALDFAGYGKSEKPHKRQAYSLDEAADVLYDLACTLKRAHKGCAPVIVGYSFGGRVLVSAACKHKNIPVRALVLESCGLGYNDERDRDSARAKNKYWIEILREAGIEHFVELWQDIPLFESQKTLPKYLQANLHKQRLDNSEEVLALSLEEAGAQHMPCRQKIFSRLKELCEQGIPICYIAGKLDKKYSALGRSLATFMLPAAAQATAAQPASTLPIYAQDTSALPTPESATLEQPNPVMPTPEPITLVPFRFSLIDGAGHNIHFEKPEEFVRKLCAFSNDFLA